MFIGTIQTMSIDEALALIEIANRYLVHRLKEITINFLLSGISTENVFDILYTASSYSLSSLHTSCMRFIENNFDLVIKTEGFLQIDASILMEIILSNNLVVAKEERYMHP